MSGAFSVSISENGRDGTVRYRDAEGTLDFYWEFGGGEVISLVSVGTAEEWRARYPWAFARRAEILSRVGAEVVRQRAPTCRVELDEAQGVLRVVLAASRAGFTSPAGSVPLPIPLEPPPATWIRRWSEMRTKLATYLGLGAIVLALIAWFARSLFEIQTTGAPWGTSFRVGGTIATLTSRLEPYLPSLHRDPAQDRYTLGLLLHDAASDAAPRFVELARGRSGSDLQHAKLVTSAGDLLWFRTPEEGACDVRTGRLYGPGELARDARLALPQRPVNLADYASGDQQLLRTLSAVARLAPTRWLGVLSEEDAAKTYPLGSSVSDRADFERSGAPRRLYRGEVAIADGRERLAQLEAEPGAAFYNGAFVRTSRDGAVLRLEGPTSALLLHESERFRRGSVQLARVDENGRLLWRTDTGIGELHQVLPDPQRPAFLGARPKLPDHVGEPILVVVDVRDGSATTRSLWQKD
ncbi:MAG: hypothetical protein JNM84_23385 [Planctomycetes bacterium]|nr:hypothetical protein [Planctomycetota bacterium]